jgi:hybrid cluster-associated redox disulfide protein
MTINGDLSVDEVMRRWPGAIEIFIRWRMLCVGCSIARFCTIAEACADHHVPLQDFLAELQGQTETCEHQPPISA